MERIVIKNIDRLGRIVIPKEWRKKLGNTVILVWEDPVVKIIPMKDFKLTDLFDKIEFSEKQVEINLGNGVVVTGRIDLVRRIDTGETTIVDLKSSERAQAEDVTEAQLHVYALGYQELTGRRPDYVEIYELEERKRKPRSVDDDFIADVKTKVREAADALRRGELLATPAPSKCASCDYRGMCSAAA